MFNCKYSDRIKLNILNILNNKNNNVDKINIEWLVLEFTLFYIAHII